MKVETYLKQGIMLDQRINYQLKKLAELRENACSIPAVMPKGGKVQTSPEEDAPFVRALMRMEEQEERINREIELLVELKDQIREVIGQVEDDNLRMVLAFKYLEGMSFEKIGDVLHANKSTVYRWHKQAVGKITLPENAIIAKFRF